MAVSYVNGTSFNVYSLDEIRKLSVKQIKVATAYDSLGHPVVGGLYDPALGPLELGALCTTCKLTSDDCPGHCGHIEMVVPVYNPVFFPQMFNILKRKCFHCHKFRMSSLKTRVFAVKLMLLDHGEVVKCVNLDEELAKRGVDGPEALQDEIKRQAAILDEYEAKYGEATGRPKGHHCREVRAGLISEFLSSQPPASCANCQASTVSIRREGFVKIFQKPLSKRAKTKMATLGLSFTSAIASQARIHGLDDLSDDEKGDDEEEEEEELGQSDAGDKPVFMPVSEVESQLRALWGAEAKIVNRIWCRRTSGQPRAVDGWAQFFMHAVLVPPNKFRPPQHGTSGDGMFEHVQNMFYSKILTLNGDLAKAGVGTPPTEAGSKPLVDLSKVIGLWIDLQDHVNRLMDSSKALTFEGLQSNAGIRQVLERKEGLFRKNMMGKRVNYAARSVISPDPYIGTDQIGVPVRFAKKLTYAEPVTAWNAPLLRDMVLNGPEQHPGANFVEDEGGNLVDLSKRSRFQREALAKTLLTQSSSSVASLGASSAGGVKRVWRHLKDDDIVLMNRQPTLHKPSIMAHRVRVLRNEKEQPLRMHYANCKTYNADFDGDEMNMHFPQDELARSEAYNIVATSYQYVVPTSGQPIRGLIQDHVGVAVILTQRDRFLNRDQYCQLVYAAVQGLPRFQSDASAPLPLLPPTILKPTPLWTGKQVISSLLIALTSDLPQPACFMNLDGSAKVTARMWGESGELPGDQLVIVRQNELLLGVIDKNSVGSQEYGLTHSVYELYGAQRAGALLSAIGRLLTIYLQMTAITCGMEDLVLKPAADSSRREMIAGAMEAGVQAAAKFAGVAVPEESKASENQEMIESIRVALRAKLSRAVPVEGVSVNAEAFAALDNAIKAVIAKAHSAINEKCLKTGLRREFPLNAFSLMIGTGAKGSPVNHTMIVGGLGQQELEGRRVPVMVSGKTLPSFPAFHPSPRAGGYVSDRFLTGLRPQDYYFHCMSGREGLVDTAVKTSRSGYLQRCLAKHLEDVRVEYDHSVRDSEGNVIQFLYGDDGLDVCSTSFLQGGDSQLSFLAKNYQALAFKYALNSAAFQRSGLDVESAPGLHESIQRSRHQLSVFNGSRSAWVPAKGDTVILRDRIDDNEGWSPANLCLVWVEGVVSKVRPGKNMDIKLDDGRKVKKVPLAIPGAVLPHIQPRVPDPVLAQLSLSNHVGVVSERFQDKLESYIERNPHSVLIEDVEDSSPKGVLSKVAFNLLMWMKSMRSCVDAGEPVGVIAAQSLGEPSTQMTLNTFHLAGHGGVNVTLGIPRLREIVMTASAAIKTPTMTLPLLVALQGDRKVAASAARALSKLSVADLLATSRHDGGIVVVDQLQPKIPSAATSPHSEWIRSYHIRLYLVDPEAIQDAFGLSFDEVANSVGKKFTQALLSLLQADIRRAGGSSKSAAEEDQVGVVNVTATRAGGGGGDGEADGEAEEAPTPKSTKKRKDDDDEDDDAGSEDGNIRLGTRKPVKGYDDGDDGEDEEDEGDKSEDETNDLVEMDDVEPPTPTKVSKRANSVGATGAPDLGNGIRRVDIPGSLAKNKLYGDCLYSATEAWVELVIRFPPSARKVMMLQAAEKAVQKALIRQTKGVSRCFVSSQEESGKPPSVCVQAEGVNFEAVWSLGDVFDVNKIASNDIAAIGRCYGVEASRQAITREIKTVFGAYGIAVDARHLSLIADYMTMGGGYRPLNRLGMDACCSPYQQMSFETTTQFLAKACLHGDSEAITSASSRLVMGRVVGSGTGAFELLHPVSL